MPVSEDEFERPIQMGENQGTMTKAEQRKSNKPIMEKRRRARINHCLNELKTLILDAMKKDPARHSKLEKADILEMTVKHLQQIQRQQLATAVATDPAVIMRFKNGFDECAAEVSRYINRLDGVDTGVKQRLTAHLHRCVSSIQHISTFPHQNFFSTLTQNCDKNGLVLPNLPSSPGDVNNNSNQNGERIQIPSGLHLIPSRLPTGELALLLPNSNHISSLLNVSPGTTIQFPQSSNVGITSVMNPISGSLNPNTNHTSAFTAVTKNADYPSPTSTADVKKESKTLDLDDYRPFLSDTCIKEFTQNVKNNKINNANDNYSRKVYLVEDVIEPNKFARFKSLEVKSETHGFDQKVMQRPSSSSFQTNVADSTTSFLHPKESELQDSSFKSFQVDIPNTHLKAKISMSNNVERMHTTLPVTQKPNPNFTLNPNKFPFKATQRYLRNSTNMGEMTYEKFLKIEPVASSTADKPEEEGNLEPSMERSIHLLRSETFQNMAATSHGIKRPRESPDITQLSSLDSPNKTPRISLNVTVTDDQSKNENFGNHCKRISVIVEDSSKKENKNEVTVNVSQKDMWRPW